MPLLFLPLMLSLAHLRQIAEAHADSLSHEVAAFDIRGTTYSDESGPKLMGVVNLSADSWYRESVCLSAEKAIERGMVLKSQGAGLVDVGAESTLPDAALVTGDAQSSKLVPVIKGLTDGGVAVSVETYKSDVARVCLEAGAAVLNLTGSRDSSACYELAAAHEAGVIICFVAGDDVRNVSEIDITKDLFPVMRDYFRREIEKAERVGLRRIFIDPGMGFYYRNLTDGKARVAYQMSTFLNSFRFRKLGFPVCHALPHAFETFGQEVRTAEGFFAVLAALGQTSLFRTHEVGRVKAVLDTMGMIE